MRISRGRGFSLVELMVVIAILVSLFVEWRPDYGGLGADGRRTAMEVEIRTIEHGCEAFRRSHGRYPFSIGELCDAGILDRRPDPYREGASGWAILLIPSAPGRKDLARARITTVADWAHSDPPGGWGWD